DSKAEIEFQLGLTVLEKIETEIDKDIKAFEEDEQNKILAELLKQKTYLAHKEKLALRFTDIENLHKNLIWVNKANKFNKQGFKTQSTNTEKRLSKQYFNADYIKSFNEECEKLEGKFGIEIDARSSDAQSNRQLFLKGKDPSSILSEGEQKVIALADFFAETNITTINKGIVFDDPVTSLDEERKKVIAKRICELSQSKQVLVFTHDLVFVSALINYCTDFQIPYRCHSIENLEEPGKIYPDNTPSHEAKYKTSAEARRYIKLAKDADPEIREVFIKSGFAALRSSYEAFVIFELFCGAVKRFDDRVSIDSLKGLHVDDSLVKEIMDNFKLCCRYMEGHIHSDKYLAAKPQLKQLQEEADRFDTMRSKLDKLKKEHGKK